MATVTKNETVDISLTLKSNGSNFDASGWSSLTLKVPSYLEDVEVKMTNSSAVDASNGKFKVTPSSDEAGDWKVGNNQDMIVVVNISGTDYYFHGEGVWNVKSDKTV